MALRATFISLLAIVLIPFMYVITLYFEVFAKAFYYELLLILAIVFVAVNVAYLIQQRFINKEGKQHLEKES